MVFLSSCVDFFFFFFFVLRVPLLTFGPPVGFYAGVTQDVASDSVPFLGFPLLAMSGLVCYMTCSLDTSCIVSSDRHSGMGPPGPGWCLNSSLQRTFV